MLKYKPYQGASDLCDETEHQMLVPQSRNLVRTSISMYEVQGPEGKDSHTATAT